MTITDVHVCGPAATMTMQTQNSLYNPEFDRDSCGFGLIANLDDLPSHHVIETAISALARLTHRGAVAADGKTGDGCGLLIKMPVDFFRAAAAEADIEVAARFVLVAKRGLQTPQGFEHTRDSEEDLARRAGHLNAPEKELFSGAFWTGKRALEMGLIHGIAVNRSEAPSATLAA